MKKRQHSTEQIVEKNAQLKKPVAGYCQVV